MFFFFHFGSLKLYDTAWTLTSMNRLSADEAALMYKQQEVRVDVRVIFYELQKFDSFSY